VSTENEHEGRLSRKEALAAAAAGAGALAVPGLLADAAEAAGEQATMALFLGQDELPVPPANATVHTSACQFCNVGCGYKIYTWPVSATPESAGARGPYPKPLLGDWISPAMVTRTVVDGKDSYVVVLPDKDCVVNKGDHSPRGGTNALTVYTKRKHPLSNPTERSLYPLLRSRKGGPLERVTWSQALDRMADETIAGRPPSASGGRTTFRRR